MGRRDDDERPPIELLGADLGITSTQQVALGPKRPKPSRGRILAIAAAVVAVLLLGLTLGGSDGDSPEVVEDERDNRARTHLDKPGTSTTERGTTTRPPTTTTTTVPVGPIFGEPVEGVLLLRNAISWTRVDLATGTIDEIELPSADTYGSVALPGGLVIPNGLGEVRYHRVLGAAPDEEGVLLGSGDVAVRAGTDRVWLFDQPLQGEPDVATHVRLVDLGGQLIRSFTVPGYQGTATAEGVVVGRGGRIYLADEDGLRSLGIGWLNGATNDAALVTSCDGAGSCALRLVPTDGGTSRVVLDIDEPDAVYHESSLVADDGRMAVIEFTSSTSAARILLFGPDGEPLDEVEAPSSFSGARPSWLPGDLGLLIGSGSGVSWLRPTASGWEAEELPLIAARSAEAAFVVTP